MESNQDNQSIALSTALQDSPKSQQSDSSLVIKSHSSSLIDYLVHKPLTKAKKFYYNQQEAAGAYFWYLISGCLICLFSFALMVALSHRMLSSVDFFTQELLTRSVAGLYRSINDTDKLIESQLAPYPAKFDDNQRELDEIISRSMFAMEKYFEKITKNIKRLERELKKIDKEWQEQFENIETGIDSMSEIMPNITEIHKDLEKALDELLAFRQKVTPEGLVRTILKPFMSSGVQIIILDKDNWLKKYQVEARYPGKNRQGFLRPGAPGNVSKPENYSLDILSKIIDSAAGSILVNPEQFMKQGDGDIKDAYVMSFNSTVPEDVDFGIPEKHLLIAFPEVRWWAPKNLWQQLESESEPGPSDLGEQLKHSFLS